MKALKVLLFSSCVALIAALVYPTEALAVASYSVNGAGNCSGALPSFEGSLRKRPTAIANEGKAVAFVTCSLPGDLSVGNLTFQIAFLNRNDSPVSVACTFVDGYAAPFVNGNGPTFYVRETQLGAQNGGDLTWGSEDEGLSLFSPNANVSCALPPGVEIALLIAVFPDPEPAS